MVGVYPAELVEDGLQPGLPAIAGRFESGRRALWFFPRFGFMAGTSYTVFFHPGPYGLTITSRADDRPATTTILELYPTVGTIPFNQLRMYVCFSAPMSEGVAAQHVRVLDDRTENELSEALLAMDPELWDRDRRRLTLLFDPGRIKQGLRPHQESDYPLRPGRPIRVVIDSGFVDATGRPLRRSFERRYEVGVDVRDHVDPARWVVSAPKAGTDDPVVVDFDRPLDHGLVRRCIWVRASDGSRVAGRVAVGREERSWAFIPRDGWATGIYQVEADHRLEDGAGNSVSRVFDRDLDRREHNPRKESPAVVPFEVKALSVASSPAEKPVLPP
jgi:hypothetical protein